MSTIAKWPSMYPQSEDKVVCVRLLRPGFEYPNHGFRHRDALYYSSEDIVLLATKRQWPTSHGETVYTEVAIWNLEEIRLLGTLTLAVPEGGGIPVFAPWHASPISDMPLSSDLSSHSIIESCLEAAISLRVENEQSNMNKYVLRTLNYSEPKIEKDVFENIDPTDGILTRGLYTLIKSQLLMNAFDFMEEAFINLQVSREAALQIIREHLHFLGNPDPGYRDAHNYIRSNFQMGEPLVEYLESQHEKWIQTKHPVSVYGAEWAPFIEADDIYDTYGCLISIYRHIVLAEPGRSSLLTTT